MQSTFQNISLNLKKIDRGNYVYPSTKVDGKISEFVLMRKVDGKTSELNLRLMYYKSLWISDLIHSRQL